MNRSQRFAVSMLLLATLMLASSPASAAYDRSQAERYIVWSERGWSANNPNELAIVKRIIADDFVWLLDGKILRKADAIADAKRAPRTSTEHFDYLQVRFFGDTAIAQGRVHRRQKTAVTRNLFIDTWVLRDGRWQIVAATDIDVKE